MGLFGWLKDRAKDVINAVVGAGKFLGGAALQALPGVGNVVHALTAGSSQPQQQQAQQAPAPPPPNFNQQSSILGQGPSLLDQFKQNSGPGTPLYQQAQQEIAQQNNPNEDALSSPGAFGRFLGRTVGKFASGVGQEIASPVTAVAPAIAHPSIAQIGKSALDLAATPEVAVLTGGSSLIPKLGDLTAQGAATGALKGAGIASAFGGAEGGFGAAVNHQNVGSGILSGATNPVNVGLGVLGGAAYLHSPVRLNPDHIPIVTRAEPAPSPALDAVVKGMDTNQTRTVFKALQDGNSVDVTPTTQTTSTASPIQQFAAKLTGQTASEISQPAVSKIKIVDNATPPSEPPPAAPISDATLGGGGPKERKFVTSVKEDTSIPQQVRDQVAGNYTPSSSQKLYNDAYTSLKADPANVGPVEEVVASKKFDQKSGAYGQALAQHYADVGDYTSAARVFNDLAPKLTDAGQQIQTAALLNRIRPEGVQAYAIQQAAKRGITLDPAFLDNVKTKAFAAQDLPEGEAKNFATFQVMKDIANQIPTPWLDRVVTFWKAGLLTGLKTSGGNILSNVTHGTLEVAKDVPASIIDTGLSLVTGQRSKAFTLRGPLSGAAEGLGRFGKYLATGYDERNIASKYDIPRVINNGSGPLGKVATAYENFVFRMMGGEDMPFYYAAKSRSLYDQATVAKRNGEWAGSKKEFVANPPENALKNAVTDASTAVFQNNTELGMGINKLANADNQFARLAVNFIAPFRRTPASVAMQMINYSPVGAVKSVLEAIASSRKSGLTQDAQRQLVSGLGRSITGTGALVVGAELVKNGLMTLAYPKDQKEQRLWELEGKQPYSIKVNGTWRSLNYVSPVGQLLAAGGFYQDALRQSGSPSQAAEAAFAGGLKAVTDQTFLKGVSGALNALNYPQQFGEKFAEQTAGSVIPSIVRNIASATDPMQRQVKGMGQSILAGIPGEREKLLPKQDVFGRDLPRQGTTAQNILDPTRPSPAKSEPIIDALRSLQAEGDFYVPGGVKDKNQKIRGVEVNLNQQQLYQFRKEAGGATLAQFERTIAQPNYQSAAPNIKQAALKNASKDANAVTRVTSAAVPMDEKQFVHAFADLTTTQRNIIIGKNPDYVANAQQSFDEKNYKDVNQPDITPQLQGLMNSYYDLPEHSQARRDFLASNPGLKDYWNSSHAFQDAYAAKFGEDVYGKPVKSGSSGGYSKRSFGFSHRGHKSGRGIRVSSNPKLSTKVAKAAVNPKKATTKGVKKIRIAKTSQPAAVASAPIRTPRTVAIRIAKG